MFTEETLIVCICNELMLPNISTGDQEGYSWNCLNPKCPDYSAEQIEAEDLEAIGVKPWVAEYLTKAITRLLEGNE